MSPTTHRQTVPENVRSIPSCSVNHIFQLLPRQVAFRVGHKLLHRLMLRVSHTKENVLMGCQGVHVKVCGTAATCFMASSFDSQDKTPKFIILASSIGLMLYSSMLAALNDG